MYKLKADGVIRLADRAVIPADPANIDYQEFLAWVAAGNTPEPEFTPAEDAARLEKIQARTDLAALRTEYSLTDWTTIKGKDVKQAAKDQVSSAGGIPRAIEQLTIAVALLEKKLYGQF